MSFRGDSAAQSEKPLILSDLPKEVLVEILCHELTPCDLIAISQVCRVLRACSQAKTIWVRAWARDLSLPPVEYPELSLPNTIRHLRNDEVNSALTLAQVTVEGHPSDVPPITHVSYREQYFRIMKLRQHLISESTLVSKYITSGTVPGFLVEDWIDVTFSPGGEVFILWHLTGLTIFDVRPGGREYRVLMEPAYPQWTDGWYTSLAANIFTYNGVEGVVLAGSFLNMDQVNVIFIPFSSSATVVHLADVTIRGSKSLYGIFFTGYHLILFEDNVDTSSDIRIFELSCGLTYIVHVELPLRTAQILDGTYLLIALPSGVVLGAPLSRFQSDIEAISFPLEDHPDYCVISSINPHDCRAALCLPRSSLPVRPAASTTPHLSDEVNRVRCPIWCISRVYYQYSDMPSVVMGTVPLAPAPTQTIHYSTAETLDARCALTSIPPTNTTPPTLSVPSTGICSSALPTLTDVSHDENQNNVLHRLGVPQICVAPFIRPAANTRITTLPHPFHPFGNFLLLNTLEPFETIRNRLVLSQIHHSPLEDPKIEHKVLTFQDRQGNIAPPCQNDDNECDLPYRRSWYLLWNECAGIIAVVMEEPDHTTHRVHLYRLGP